VEVLGRHIIENNHPLNQSFTSTPMNTREFLSGDEDKIVLSR
jgi:hypothetical protein